MMDAALEEKIKLAPREPGVYLFKDESGKPIYVGKAGDLRDRLLQHLRGDSFGGWAAIMRERACDVDWIVTRSETEALLLEANLIKEYKPPYNIRLADDKSYPYLKITDEPYPRLLVLRDLPKGANVHIPGGQGQIRRGFHDPKRHEVYGLGRGLIFGPYPKAEVMWKLRELASELFGIRQCRKAINPQRPTRPCLNYHIKRCVGPCRGDITTEEYNKIVEQVALLLEGRIEEVRRQLHAKMEKAAAELDFERAASFRDKIKALEAGAQEQLVNAAAERDQDVLGVAQEGDWAVVELFPVRVGRLLDPQHFSFTHTRGRLPAEIIEAALSIHYSQNVLPPRQILLPEPLPEAAEWERMLAELRGGAVQLLVPQRGEKRKLIELAEKNAQIKLIQFMQERSHKKQESLAALNDLAEALQMSRRPARIECYDISNIQGQEAVGAMIVFTDGLPDKRYYRRFKIRMEGKPDDYAMLAEIVRRRLRRGLGGDEKFLPLPDLLLVDGGKGQVGTIARVLDEENVADNIILAGLAKREEAVYMPGRSEPINMEEHPRGWFLLQRIRDEAHRFAHTYHEGLRRTKIVRSQLDNVPGIGPARRAALLRAFPSLQAMSEASIEELAAVPGMNRKAAENLHHFLLQAQNTEEAVSADNAFSEEDDE